MAGVNTGDDARDRSALYLGRGVNGVALNREFAFYPGGATIPNSFTGNLILGAAGDGPGANLINGIAPPIVDVEPCEDIVIESVVCQVFDDLNITALYNALPDDIYILFNTSTGQALQPLIVVPILGGVIVVFNDNSPPADAGAWSFKIMRAANPRGCFFVKPNAVVI